MQQNAHLYCRYFKLICGTKKLTFGVPLLPGLRCCRCRGPKVVGVPGKDDGEESAETEW